MGEDLFANLDSVKELSTRLGLPTTEREAATIVGWAKGISDIERAAVRACLRPGAGNAVEFRVIADNGIGEPWREVPTGPP